MDFPKAAKERMDQLTEQLKGKEEEISKIKSEFKALERYLKDVGLVERPKRQRRGRKPKPPTAQ